MTYCHDYLLAEINWSKLIDLTSIIKTDFTSVFIKSSFYFIAISTTLNIDEIDVTNMSENLDWDLILSARVHMRTNVTWRTLLLLTFDFLVHICSLDQIFSFLLRIDSDTTHDNWKHEVDEVWEHDCKKQNIRKIFNLYERFSTNQRFKSCFRFMRSLHLIQFWFNQFFY